MEERILTIKDDLIAETLESLRKASRKANRLMDDYKPSASVQERCVITVTTASYLISV